ncbi:MAG: hypothetical protein LBK66_11280 [Spirochaetaceae bacterium]|nr:hypothetical protein [Spirochaetaceae bacterium]
MTPLYIALLNRIIKKITLYMEATMTFDTGCRVALIFVLKSELLTPPEILTFYFFYNGIPARSSLGCVKTQKIEMILLYIALLNRIIKKITLYMEATMTFDTGWHVTPLAGWRVGIRYCNFFII